MFFGPMMTNGKVSLNLYGRKGSEHKNEILLVIAEYIFSKEQLVCLLTSHSLIFCDWQGYYIGIVVTSRSNIIINI